MPNKVFKLVSPQEIKKLFEENYILFCYCHDTHDACISCYYTHFCPEGIASWKYHLSSSWFFPCFLLSYLFVDSFASRVFLLLFLLLLINLERALLDKYRDVRGCNPTCNLAFPQIYHWLRINRFSIVGHGGICASHQNGWKASANSGATQINFQLSSHTSTEYFLLQFPDACRAIQHSLFPSNSHICLSVLVVECSIVHHWHTEKCVEVNIYDDEWWCWVGTIIQRVGMQFQVNNNQQFYIFNLGRYSVVIISPWRHKIRDPDKNW